MQPKKRNTHGTVRRQVVLTLFVYGVVALVLILGQHVDARRSSRWSPPINLGPTVNTASTDSQPAISKDGRSLYFSSNRPGGIGNVDIYVTQRANPRNPWGTPVNLGPTVNTTSSEGNMAFSSDGHLMFFQSDRPGGLGGIDIWVSWRRDKHDDFAWQTPVNLGAGVNSTASDNGPGYFNNNKEGAPQLYFGSNRVGGPGGLDIYMSEQIDGCSFGPAVLVTELSSPMADNRLSIRRDGLEIFFQSDRIGSHVGPTGSPTLDLWVATRESTLDAWSTPVNLGDTINTGLLEQTPYLSSDGKTLFFASDRAGGSGGLDLYVSTRAKRRGWNNDHDHDSYDEENDDEEN